MKRRGNRWKRCIGPLNRISTVESSSSSRGDESSRRRRRKGKKKIEMRVRQIAKNIVNSRTSRVKEEE